MIHIYGIKNCNSVKKALDWMNENSIEFEFHDFKKEGVTEDQIKTWAELTDWNLLVNKKGTTWRKLSEEVQNSMDSLENSIPVFMENTSLIKRPVIHLENQVILGFDPEQYQKLIK